MEKGELFLSFQICKRVQNLDDPYSEWSLDDAIILWGLNSSPPPPVSREYTAEIMFESFNVPGLYIAVQVSQPVKRYVKLLSAQGRKWCGTHIFLQLRISSAVLWSCVPFWPGFAFT